MYGQKSTSNQVALNDLTELVRKFAAEREWEQFHTVRNLVLALVGEVGELAAEVQWIADGQVAESLGRRDKKALVAAELADVLTYVLRLADVLDVNLAEEVIKKISVNEERYPADKSRGSAEKYTKYE
jgi:NTP pyrophosphatase (non-canonical NTP hydrolase)